VEEKVGISLTKTETDDSEDTKDNETDNYEGNQVGSREISACNPHKE
jgi:hypothetical protein